MNWGHPNPAEPHSTLSPSTREVISWCQHLSALLKIVSSQIIKCWTRPIQRNSRSLTEYPFNICSSILLIGLIYKIAIWTVVELSYPKQETTQRVTDVSQLNYWLSILLINYSNIHFSPITIVRTKSFPSKFRETWQTFRSKFRVTSYTFPWEFGVTWHTFRS